MKTAFLPAIMVLSCVSAPTSASAGDLIPQELVGVWTSDESAFRGDALISGTAVYIAPNGLAVQMGGPPPIGVKFEASFDAAANKLIITRLFNPTAHGWESIPSKPGSTMIYDPDGHSLRSSGASNLLHRRTPGLTAAMTKALGLDCPPLECPIP